MTDKRLRPRKRPGQQRAVETRERLLAAAARIFSRYGCAAGTTNRIAEEAGESSVHRFVARAERGDPAEIQRFEDELVAMLTRYLAGGAGPEACPVHAEG